MRKLSYINIFLLLFLLFSCGTRNTSEGKLIGGNRDKHGCLVAAGYTWSYIKQTCIRPFEEGIALLQVDKSSTYSSATYLIFNSNYREAEIFTPKASNSIILKQDKGQNYTNKKYHLIQENNKWILYIEKNKAFEQEK